MRILDCTLRDGGYYTNWDFTPSVINAYIVAMNRLPIDYLEVGYRNNPNKKYLGKFGYTPVSILKHLRNSCDKKIAVMLNEKSTGKKDLEKLLKPIQGLADMVRLAVDPQRFESAVELAEGVKGYGFEVGFNTMYMSKWHEYSGFLSNLNRINGIADLFYMVDSFGSTTPDEIVDIIEKVKENTLCPIGFHGHNNLQLGLINTLTAIDCGVDCVDVTILGMGRGAGNLSMELLLTFLNKQGMKVDFNILGDVITAFQPLLNKYNWGTNLPYMLSGANSIPQKEVMAWTTNRRYSFNSIIRALDNKKNHKMDNAKYPILNVNDSDNVLIIGGGNSVIEHNEAIREYIEKNPMMPLIFVTARYAAFYNNLPNPKYYCLVGNEAKRLSTNIPADEFNGICVLAPYPRTMGTEVPEFAQKSTYELNEITFSDAYRDSCTTVALQTAIELGAIDINIIGYDGYAGQILSEKETDLTTENRTLFRDFIYNKAGRLISLTPSLYQELKISSIYQFL